MENQSRQNKVEHPEHYTQGKIECINAIESAVTGLEGIEAFRTGSAIKYLWRWSLAAHTRGGFTLLQAILHGEYCPDGCFCLKGEHVEVIEGGESKWLN